MPFVATTLFSFLSQQLQNLQGDRILANQFLLINGCVTCESIIVDVYRMLAFCLAILVWEGFASHLTPFSPPHFLAIYCIMATRPGLAVTLRNFTFFNLETEQNIRKKFRYSHNLIFFFYYQKKSAIRFVIFVDCLSVLQHLFFFFWFHIRKFNAFNYYLLYNSFYRYM